MHFAELPVDQPPAVVFTAFADAWPRAIETEIGATYAPLDAGKDFEIFSFALGWEGGLF